jgi:hypothetical protein
MVFKVLASAAISCLFAASCGGDDAPRGEARQEDSVQTTPEQPHRAVCSGGRFTCKSRARTDESGRIRSFTTPSGLGPADLASAYKLVFNPCASLVRKIAIVTAFNYQNVESDLATYRSQFGLPPCTKASGCLQVVNQNGASSPLPAAAPAGDDWNLEAALDLDMASAACPTCKLVLVEAQDDQGNGLFVAQNAAAALPGVVAISNSWGEPSPGNEASLDAQFFTHTQNVNVFVSSGDGGSPGGAGDYPSTSAHVIAVGGTTLTKSATTRGWTEAVWSGSGSACSHVLAQPAFQQGVVPSSVCVKRATSDVSAFADTNTGVAVFNANDGGFLVLGGTSVSSPFVAGVYARYGISGASHDASFAYSHKTEFFDITTGSNGNCPGVLCHAAVGWDGPSGIGSPNGAMLQATGSTCCPSCAGKTCGDDGCGGSCGTCPVGDTCSTGGTCACVPNCAGKTCGNDGCGGSCGTCPVGDTCSTGGTCVCVPNCAGKTCGNDGCGGSCGTCSFGTCSTAGTCVSSCGHSLCSTGVALVATCDSCVAQICSMDAFCCDSVNGSWNSMCVGEVTSICGQTCGP